MAESLVAGAATVDVTPKNSQFLFGYPHIPRMSTGVHDPLLSSALFLSDGVTPLLFVANDVIFVERQSAVRVRKRIETLTGVPSTQIMVTATHTHSGPLTFDMLSNEADSVVPKTDPRYVAQLEDGIVEAAIQAFKNRQPAAIGFGEADGSCVGTNRHDPKGPSNPVTPVMVVRNRETQAAIAAMVVCSMHPTVLHEDSTLISGDFPAMTREYLQENVLGTACPVVYHTGPSGNQSPRHVTRANTFDEAERLGRLLGQSIAQAIESMEFRTTVGLSAAQAFVDLPARKFPAVNEAERQLGVIRERFDRLRESQADRREVRTAECDWFGAEETLSLARAAADGRLQTVQQSLVPAEIMLMTIGPWSFAGWPGECFVEFSLAVREKFPNCHIISLANGELQGYLVTKEAVDSHWYEGMNSLFECPQAPMAIVEKTLQMLAESR